MPRFTLSLLVALSVLLSAAAFAPIQQNARKQSALSALILPAIEVNVAAVQQNAPQSTSGLQDGVQKYLSTTSPVESSTLSLSLKDRPPPPTAEELDAKKRNFNLFFWGGGFVAPFVATVYYFGPRFWKY
jgi:hypothetical protein